MRGLIPPEDRNRFERLISEVEQAVWDAESVTADLARLVAIAITEAPLAPPATVELTDVVAAALRRVDALLASRGVLVDIEAAPAVFVMGDRARLTHLLETALSVAASAARPRAHVRLRYGAADGVAILFHLAPYRARDPRVTIVDALARAQHVQVECDGDALTLRLPAVIGATSV